MSDDIAIVLRGVHRGIKWAVFKHTKGTRFWYTLSSVEDGRELRIEATTGRCCETGRCKITNEMQKPDREWHTEGPWHNRGRGHELLHELYKLRKLPFPANSWSPAQAYV